MIPRFKRIAGGPNVDSVLKLDPKGDWVTYAACKALEDERNVAELKAFDQHVMVGQSHTEIEKLQAELAKCYRLTGSDPDGDDDAHLAKHAVQAVKELREDSEKEVEKLENELAQSRPEAAEWEDRALTAESQVMELEERQGAEDG